MYTDKTPTLTEEENAQSAVKLLDVVLMISLSSGNRYYNSVSNGDVTNLITCASEGCLH
jgi:hypothetical protein